MSAAPAENPTPSGRARSDGSGLFEAPMLFLGLLVQLALASGLVLVLFGAQPAAISTALILEGVFILLAYGLSEGANGALNAAAALAAGAVGAIVLGGGLGGPFTPWSLLPLAAVLWLDGAFYDGLALSLAALALGGAGSLAFASPRPDGALGALLGLEGALPALLAMGLGAARLARREAEAPLAPSAPAPVVDDLQRRIEGLDAARAEAEADKARMAEALQTRSRFFANMSHELRTPLNAIMGFSDIMRARMFGELPPKYGEYADLIHESGRHLLDLINDVLDLSKLEAERFHLDLQTFDVRDAVEAAIRLTQVQAREAGIRLHAVLPPEPLAVHADERAIKQIVLNLVSNALKFTPGGGEVSVTAEARDSALFISVIDTGIGIAREDLARLGRPFEQAGDAEGRAMGTGLGLSLVRALSELHGGEMTLESTLGEGTAVTVRLPVLVEGKAVHTA